MSGTETFDTQMSRSLVTYVKPDVSGTYAPMPNNGGRDMKQVLYSQMHKIIKEDTL